MTRNVPPGRWRAVMWARRVAAVGTHAVAARRSPVSSSCVDGGRPGALSRNDRVRSITIHCDVATEEIIRDKKKNIETQKPILFYFFSSTYAYAIFPKKKSSTSRDPRARRDPTQNRRDLYGGSRKN